jgi:hypothetical protein
MEHAKLVEQRSLQEVKEKEKQLKDLTEKYIDLEEKYDDG